MELAKLNDEKKTAAIRQIRDHMKQLIEAYRKTREKTPKETVELLADVVGQKACVEAVANLVNGNIAFTSLPKSILHILTRLPGRL